MGTANASNARAELARMRQSLIAWMKTRRAVDEVAAGKRQGKVPAEQLRAQLPAMRLEHETALANKLYDLLAQVMDEQVLPDPNPARDPDVAVKLASIAVLGRADGERPLPAQVGGIMGSTTIWPLVIGGGVLLFLMHGVSTLADVAKEKERLACVQAGACSDSGSNMVKMVAIAGAAFVGWRYFESKKGGR